MLRVRFDQGGGVDKVRSFVRRSAHLHALHATCGFTTCIPDVLRDVDDIVSVSEVREKTAQKPQKHTRYTRIDGTASESSFIWDTSPNRG